MMSAVKCVNLASHRPVPLGIKTHYMFIKNFFKIKIKINSLYPMQISKEVKQWICNPLSSPWVK